MAVAVNSVQSSSNSVMVIYADATWSSKGDGIPDRWKIQYWGTDFMSNPSTDATADPDGDGMNNLAEYKAGTNPTDHKSLLIITQEAMDANGNVVIRWPAVKSVTYQVEWSSDLLQWFGVYLNTAESDGIMTWTDSGPISGTPTHPLQEKKRFYQIKIP